MMIMFKYKILCKKKLPYILIILILLSFLICSFFIKEEDIIKEQKSINQIKKSDVIKIGVLAKQEIPPYENYRKTNYNVVVIQYRIIFTVTIFFLIIITLLIMTLTHFRDKLLEALETSKIIEKKAHTANNAKTVFLANMSHEIRNPLNVIIGFSDLLKERITDKKSKEIIEIIYSNSKNLNLLLDNIMDLAKIESGKVEYKKEVLNMEDFIKGIERLFKIQVVRKKLKFKICRDEALPVYLTCYRMVLLEIISNILGNSIKFTEKGHIYISFDFKKINEKTGSLILIMEDTGSGISIEKQEKIFEAFKTGNHANSKTGLGLSIVKKLLDMVGGTVKIETEIDRGTKFTINIPCELSNIKTISATNKKETPVGNKKINVISAEDNEINQEFLKKLIAHQGWNFTGVENGELLLEELKKNEYDFILMDVRMKEIEGLEATREVRKIEKYKNIPIIGVSAQAFSNDRKAAFDAGMNEYMTKPIDKEKLINFIKKYSKF